MYGVEHKYRTSVTQTQDGALRFTGAERALGQRLLSHAISPTNVIQRVNMTPMYCCQRNRSSTIMIIRFAL